MTNDTTTLRRFAETADPDLFNALVRAYAPMVRATCRRRLGPGVDADDAVQETFLKLLRRAGDVRVNVAAWLHAAALTTCLDRQRRATTRRRHEAAAARPDRAGAAADATAAQVRAAVDAALAELPEARRELLVRRFLMDTPQRTLAAEAGVADSTMSKRVHAALDELRGHLARRGVTAPAAAITATCLADTVAAASTPCSAAGVGKLALAGTASAPAKAAPPLAAVLLAGTLTLAAAAGGGYLLLAPGTPPAAAAPATPVRGAVLRPAADVNGDSGWNGVLSTQGADAGVAFTNMTAGDLVRLLETLHAPEQLADPAGLAATRYDGEAADMPALRTALRDEAGLTWDIEQRPLQAIVLGPPADGAAGPTPAADPAAIPNMSIVDGLRYTSADFDFIARGLSIWLSTPVVNETGLTGGYDVTLPRAADLDAGPAAAPAALGRALGLTVTRAERQVPVAVLAGRVFTPARIDPSGVIAVNAAVGADGVTFGNMHPFDMIGKVEGLRALSQFTFDAAEVPPQTYDADVRGAGWRGRFRAALARELGVTYTTETRTLPVLVLGRPVADLKPTDEPAGGRYFAVEPGTDEITWYNTSPETLAEDLGMHLGLPVIDETGVTGRYDVPYVGEAGEPLTADAAADRARATGFAVTVERRPMPAVTIVSGG